MPMVQEYINNRNKYKVDRTYQRPDGVWSNEDKQCFIDSLLRGEPIPIFFVNYDSSKQLFYIVDGQQRLNCISMFYDNKIKLSRKFSDEDNHGKTFNAENPLDDGRKKQFLEYNLTFHILEDYDDERVRVIFSRLQRGKPLQIGERLNAKPGEIVRCMRVLASHPFLAKSTAVAKNRYGVYPDAARILFYEKYKTKQCGSSELYGFFDDNRTLDKSCNEYKSATKVLNCLGKCFPPNDGPYRVFEKHAWVFAVYGMIRELQVAYSLIGHEQNVGAFVRDFHRKVYNEDFRRSKTDYQRFYDNIRGGWSEKIVALRRDTLIKEFLSKHKVPELDDKRQISDEDKLALFAVHSNCERCGCAFKEYRDAEYHHRQLYSEGGKTTKQNIMVLCRSCHDFIHGRKQLESPSEKEIVEGDDEE